MTGRLGSVGCVSSRGTFCGTARTLGATSAGAQGHYARECGLSKGRAVGKCALCLLPLPNCTCAVSSEESSVEGDSSEIEEEEEEEVVEEEASKAGCSRDGRPSPGGHLGTS